MKTNIIRVKRLKGTNHSWDPIIKHVPSLFDNYELVKEEFDDDGKVSKQFFEYTTIKKISQKRPIAHPAMLIEVTDTTPPRDNKNGVSSGNPGKSLVEVDKMMHKKEELLRAKVEELRQREEKILKKEEALREQMEDVNVLKRKLELECRSTAKTSKCNESPVAISGTPVCITNVSTSSKLSYNGQSDKAAQVGAVDAISYNKTDNEEFSTGPSRPSKDVNHNALNNNNQGNRRYDTLDEEAVAYAPDLDSDGHYIDSDTDFAHRQLVEPGLSYSSNRGENYGNLDNGVEPPGPPEEVTDTTPPEPSEHLENQLVDDVMLDLPAGVATNRNDGWILLPKKNNLVTVSDRDFTGAHLVQRCPNCIFMIRIGDRITRRNNECWEHVVCPQSWAPL